MAIPTEFELTFACRHVGTIDLSALPADRRSGRLEYLRAKSVCNACSNEQRWQRHPPLPPPDAGSAETAYALNWALDRRLPPLTGTARQFDSGSRVRYQLLRSLHQWSVQEHRDPVEYARAEAAARRIAGARWWLDQKHLITTPGDLLELLEVAVASRDGQVCENSA